MSNSIIHRGDYEPYPFLLHSVYLNVDLYEDHALVTATLDLERVGEGPLYLHGQALTLLSIQCDSQPLKVGQLTEGTDHLIVHEDKPRFKLTTVTRIKPQENSQLSGLYRSGHLFCTQCEAEGFRRITFFPDRPDVLATYTTRITADAVTYPILLSNGNLQSSEILPEGRHAVVWVDPFKKASYLFALVAGDLACVRDNFETMSGKNVQLALYVEKNHEAECAHALTSLKHAMRWDEEQFGREYDLELYMIVAVSDFNMGAMENKGLNIFNSKYVLAQPSTATDEDYAHIESVIAHEYFHNWTGNRVTCRDWFQLSLKEGLTVFRDQEFSRDMNSRDVKRIEDVITLKTTQFPEDAGSMAHPVRPESYQEINNFYTATIYNKGAEVIRMQRTLLGEEGFRRGMDLYFDRHDGSAVTIDDFVAAMEDANHRDLSAFKYWYSQAGTPVVEVDAVYASGTLTLLFRQSCRATPECQEKKPFYIPIRVALFDETGQQLPLEEPVWILHQTSQTLQFSSLAARPVVSLLRDFSAPVIIKYAQNRSELILLLRFESNGYAKWNAARQLVLDVLRTAIVSSTQAVILSEDFVEAFRYVLQDETLDMALRALLLTPPSFDEVLAEVPGVDVALVEQVRDGYREALGKALIADFLAMYQSLFALEDHCMEGQAYGRRKLRNVCLWFGMKCDTDHMLAICQYQFDTAITMTDKLLSFALLASVSHESVRKIAIEAFYQQYKTDALVLDKWFTVQAMAEPVGALSRVEALLQHPDFQLKNPNKVRALIGAFIQGNPRHFHAIDGSGYRFLTRMLLALDAINPQIAARLATPFTRGQRLDAERQSLMREQLVFLSTQPLSKDLRELIDKSLV